MAIPSPAENQNFLRSAIGIRTNRLGADFLQIDSEIALTFSSIAIQASDPGKRRRMIDSARKAYDTILRLRQDVELSHAEVDKLVANLQRLKRELLSLGESL